MVNFRRWLLWGVIATPVVVLPSAFLFSKLWLNRHLNRDISIGDTHIRLVRPKLGWNFNFASDSLLVTSPAFSARTGRLRVNFNLWHGLNSFGPSVELGTDTILVSLPLDRKSVV